MRFLAAIVIFCLIITLSAAGDLKLVVGNTARTQKTYILKAKEVHLFGMSVDMDNGGISIQITAARKENVVTIVEHTIVSKDDVSTETTRKTSIPLKKLPYAHTPTDKGLVGKINISQVEAKK